jgi:hypothetical protein
MREVTKEEVVVCFGWECGDNMGVERRVEQ